MHGGAFLCDWGFIADQIGVGCMNWMRFEEPIEPESVCRVTFSGGVVLAESLVLKGKAKSVRRRREKSDSRSNSGGGGSDRSDHYC